MERLTIKFNEEVIEWETLRFRFERYLKREAGIYSEPGAKNTRNLIIAQVEEFVFRKAKEIRPLSMEALYDEVKQIAEQFGGEELIKTLTTRRRAIPLFFKFLESNGYKPKEAEIRKHVIRYINKTTEKKEEYVWHKHKYGAHSPNYPLSYEGSHGFIGYASSHPFSQFIKQFFNKKSEGCGHIKGKFEGEPHYDKKYWNA